MRSPRRGGTVLAIAAALAAGCASGLSPGARSKPPAGVTLIGTAHPRAVPAAATLRAAAQGEAAFATVLYRQLAGAGGNIAIAPSSIATVLGMIEAGARGATAQQLVAALHVPLPVAELPAALGGLAQALAARSGQGVTLDEVDQAWLQQRRSVLAPFAATLAGPFGAPLATIDFGRPDAAAATINQWFADHTHGRIAKLLSGADLENQVALVLTDAVYLDAKWAHGFDPKRTAPAPFHLAAGAEVPVATMHLAGQDIHTGPPLEYAAGAGWRAVALPYLGGRLELDVILPDDLASFEASLDEASLAAIVASFRPAVVALALPKFDVTASSDLIPALRRLGVRDVFAPVAADLSGIDGTPDLYVSAVKHEVVVHVDEQGTVAAAATAGIAVATALPRLTVVDVDRPFVYAVRDRTTGAVLFLGRITDPR